MKLTIENFDDIVIDEESGHEWSQICSECKAKLDRDNVQLSDYCNASHIEICGVKDCNNEAEYYVDFETKEERLKNVLDNQTTLCDNYYKEVFKKGLDE